MQYFKDCAEEDGGKTCGPYFNDCENRDLFEICCDGIVELSELELG